MEPVLTPTEMAAADARTIGAGTPVEVLMDRAEWFDKHLDVPTAGKTDVEGHVVRNPKGRDFRLAGLEHLLRLFENSALDASVGDRAGHLPGAGHEHLRAERARARSPCFDHRGDGDLFALARPLIQLLQYFSHVDFRIRNSPSDRPLSRRVTFPGERGRELLDDQGNCQ